jgi:hypothetical protein
MNGISTLNLFYEEPDSDRWIKLDRYARKFIRRLIRGKQRPGGVMTIAINLMKGLESIGMPYRFNDYRYIQKHPEEIACIIGKPQLLFDRKWSNPIIFGAGVYSHPIDHPLLFKQFPNVKRFLVPGNWMQKMCEPYYGNNIVTWPVGIDTAQWKVAGGDKDIDFLIYDKLNRDRGRQIAEVLQPICRILDEHNLTYKIVRYGSYTIGNLKRALRISKAAIFLSESETQGMAYQQILATNTPILAWDKGGYWQDPAYYPDKVKYQPVSSVPYWDDRCGVKFKDVVDFKPQLQVFLNEINMFNPRNYILENLTLEICARRYVKLFREVEKQLADAKKGVND